MCCIDRIIDFKPSSMPDLGISLDKVFYPGFDILISNDRVRVLFFITDSKSEMKMRIVKELCNGVAYNRARNELYVWFTDDELLKMKGHTVLVEVEISDIFTNSLAYSTIETIYIDPIIRKRCTYSTSFNDSIVNDLRSAEKFIKLDKSKSKKLEFDRKEDMVDALRYALLSGYKPTKGLTFNKVKEEIEKSMNKKTVKDIDRIVITKDGENGVLLRAYSDDEIVEKTIAKCNPNDIFDFNIGAKLAVDRLYDGYDMTPKPKRKLYNGKIFVRADMRTVTFDWDSFKSQVNYSRENKIWEVKDGKIIGLGGICRPMDPIYEDMTDEELTKLLIKSNSLYIGYYYNIVDGYFVR